MAENPENGADQSSFKLINVVALILISRVDAEWQFILLFGVMGGVAQACQAP